MKKICPRGIIQSSEMVNSSILKEFADNNSKFDENVSKFPKRVENIVGKEEIARYEQSLHFPVFQKTNTADT